MQTWGEHVKLYTDSNPSSVVGREPLVCEAAMLPTVPQCHLARNQFPLKQLKKKYCIEGILFSQILQLEEETVSSFSLQ